MFFFEYFNQQTEDRHEPANAIYPDERRQGAPDGKEDLVQSVDAEAESINVDNGANNNDQEDNCLNISVSVVSGTFP